MLYFLIIPNELFLVLKHIQIMNRDRLTRWLYPSFGCLLLIFSLYILNQELGKYNLEEIIKSLALIRDRQLMYAFGFTILGYLVISTYDLIAFIHLKYKFNIKRILFTTFITYAVSNTTGFTLLIGGGIRYRFYSRWGVPARKIAKIIALGNLTFWIGLLTLSGLSFISNPLHLPNSVNIDRLILRLVGTIALTILFVYLYCCKTRKNLKIGGNLFTFPKITISISQIVLFSLDWALAAAVLYWLIPDYSDKSYVGFFNIYLLAMSASILSNIPGGIGIFETIIIFLLPKSVGTPAILSSLIVYRAIRFLIPLSTALLLLCCFELRQKLKISK